ncbi:copper resistance protein CopC [Novosphingobium sp. FSY-8]|uniref:Copper resistance protein CopC n=1 Tax=Novosphingobium ovatum TaxID=1908523 RepID=A0ABW9XD40_9SPHN|nr:copper resistance protein CopC [Novosphingobium ovatum]NBC36427.1 copper resistance protein CopC [Novosphingobium ovatum]
MHALLLRLARPLARPLAVAAASAAMAIAAPAIAHPKVVTATPAEGATLAQVPAVSLTFSEALVADGSSVSIVMTAMPGMADHPPMKMGGVKVALSEDKLTLTATPARPLPKGSYAAKWFVTAANGHTVEGALTFTVQ